MNIKLDFWGWDMWLFGATTYSNSTVVDCGPFSIVIGHAARSRRARGYERWLRS